MLALGTYVSKWHKCEHLAHMLALGTYVSTWHKCEHLAHMLALGTTQHTFILFTFFNLAYIYIFSKKKSSICVLKDSICTVYQVNNCTVIYFMDSTVIYFMVLSLREQAIYLHSVALPL